MANIGDTYEEWPPPPEELIPNYPHFSAENWTGAASEYGFGYIFFEWYRWVGNLTTVVAFIQPDSPDFGKISKQEYHLLSALLARCSRLMLSIIALTHERKFGEAASIIHRSLMETAVKLIWVCAEDTPERVRWLIASGLQPELEFERNIKSNIEEAAGEATELETRMLLSIENHFNASGMSKSDVANSKRLPDLFSMFKNIGWSRLDYVILQRIGSHAVHGNWPSLLVDYLEKSDIDGYDFQPRGDDVDAHPNMYMGGARLVLSAIAAYSQVCLPTTGSGDFGGLAEEAYVKLINDYDRAIELGL